MGIAQWSPVKKRLPNCDFRGGKVTTLGFCCLIYITTILTITKVGRDETVFKHTVLPGVESVHTTEPLKQVFDC